MIKLILQFRFIALDVWVSTVAVEIVAFAFELVGVNEDDVESGL